jgi:7-cyano-7-deazaguanine synthase|tara:strand:- start:3907 stop:4656 length:750 start_codon:yes stop_codon:yes gene_type:complete
MANKNKIVITLSGGMDSSVLLYKAAEQYDEVHTVTFDYGQRHDRELVAAKKQLLNVKHAFPNVIFTNKLLDVRYIKDIAPTSSLTNDNIDTPNVKDIMGEAQPKSYVPFRNLMFISILSSYAEAVKASVIWYGAAEADSLAGYWDGSKEFIECFNKLTLLNRENNIKLVAPLIKMSKKDIVLDGASLKVNFGDTYTCYSGEYPCDAESASSSLRLQGFIQAGLIDPIVYKQQDKLNAVYKKNNCKPIIN